MLWSKERIVLQRRALGMWGLKGGDEGEVSLMGRSFVAKERDIGFLKRGMLREVVRL